jgi:hypothetical protein
MSLQEGKLGTGLVMCTTYEGWSFYGAFTEKLSFVNLCVRPVLYEGHTLSLYVDEER